MPEPGNLMNVVEAEGLTLVGDTVYYLLATTDHDEEKNRPISEECQVYKFRMTFSELIR